MKRAGILNAQLAGTLARLGHTDTLVACDAEDIEGRNQRLGSRRWR